MSSLIKKFNLFEKIFFIITLLTFTGCFVYDLQSGFTIIKLVSFASITLSIFAVFLNSKKQFTCFYFYLTSSILYTISCYVSKNFGEAILYTVYMCPLYAFSLYKFITNKSEDAKKSDDTKLKPIMYLYVTIIIVVGTIAYGFILKQINSSSPFLNALATFTLLVGGYFTARKRVEQWFFWIAYSIILVILWVITFNIAFIAQNSLYIIFNTYSFIVWLKYQKKANN